MTTCENRLATKEEVFEQLNKLNVFGTFAYERQLFQTMYQSDAAIEWYTKGSALYESLNQALVQMDYVAKHRFRYFVSDLMRQIHQVHHQQRNNRSFSERTVLRTYRGQVLLTEELEQYRANIGGLVVNKSFLSTSKSASVASAFLDSQSETQQPTTVPVLFHIVVDLSRKALPVFADITQHSAFPDEDEVLFMVGSVFRIEEVHHLSLVNEVTVIRLQALDHSELNPFLLYDEDPGKDSTRLILVPFYSMLFILDRSYLLLRTAKDRKRMGMAMPNGLTRVLKDGNVYFGEIDENGIIEDFPFASDFSLCVFAPSTITLPYFIQTRPKILYDPNDVHLNDLVYMALEEIRQRERNLEKIEALFNSVSSVLCRSRKCLIIFFDKKRS